MHIVYFNNISPYFMAQGGVCATAVNDPYPHLPTVSGAYNWRQQQETGTVWISRPSPPVGTQRMYCFTCVKNSRAQFYIYVYMSPHVWSIVGPGPFLAVKSKNRYVTAFGGQKKKKHFFDLPGYLPRAKSWE